MIDEYKITTVLSQINRDTKEGKIKWQIPYAKPNLDLSSNEELVGKVYDTAYNDRILRIFKINRSIQTDEFDFSWVPDHKLVILDVDGNIDWEFPRHRGISDLYDSVRYKVANVQSFFDSFKDEIDF